MSAPVTTAAPSAQPENSPENSPGLEYLLISAMTLKDPARAELAAENVLLPVTFGIKAIGDLLADAGRSANGPISMDTIQEVGFLLTFLADVQGAMTHFIDCAHDDLLQAASKKEGKA